jgi:hypothetical protein
MFLSRAADVFEQLHLGASYLAHTHAQHADERGHIPERQRELLPGETARKRLGIPMFMGDVR